MNARDEKRSRPVKGGAFRDGIHAPRRKRGKEEGLTGNEYAKTRPPATR
jgi:hypothetical protein